MKLLFVFACAVWYIHDGIAKTEIVKLEIFADGIKLLKIIKMVTDYEEEFIDTE